MQKIERLIPCSDFVLLQEEQIKQYTTKDSRTPLAYYNILAYAKFLKQPLELWMFVPCGDDGNPLSEPKKIGYLGSEGIASEAQDLDMATYQAAKERCLFEGFYIRKWEDRLDEIDKTVLNKDGFHIFWYNTTDKEWLRSKRMKSIEAVCMCNLNLTPTALKEIYG